jgi:hypothetical protein
MKNLVLIFCLGLFATKIIAQDASLGNVVGGQINYVNIKGAEYFGSQVQLYGQTDSRTRNLGLYPYMAWKIGKRSLLGFQVGFEKYYKATPTFGNNFYLLKNHTTSYSGGIFTRHYWKPDARFSFFLEPAFNYLRSKYKQQQDDSGFFGEYQYRQFAVQLAPGIYFHATKHLGLLMRFGQVSYLNGKNLYDDDSGTPFHDFRTNFSLTSLTWGMEYRWGTAGE